MESKPQKPSLLFANPFSLWTDLAFKLWGFGTPPAPSGTPEREVAVAVIPTRDAEPPAAHPDDHAKRAQRNARRKAKAKRARR